jgi:hypothetical protein
MMKIAATAFTLLTLAGSGYAQDAADPVWPPPIDYFDSGRLLATQGVSQIEGAAGGGLVPWAVISGYGTRDAIGANGHYTFVSLNDFRVHSAGVSVGFFNRLEVSYSHLWFDTQKVGATLGLGKNFKFEQNVIGAKLRLFGDVVYDQNSFLPQIAIGAQYKISEDSDVLRLIGAKDNRSVDFYASATKLFLSESLLLNATVRMTKANQFGFLGFGGDRRDSYRPQFEGSVAYLITKNLAVGGEYRMKPDNLKFAKEENAYDLFLAYFLNKNASLTLAYANLGRIATRDTQSGVYASLQIGF